MRRPAREEGLTIAIVGWTDRVRTDVKRPSWIRVDLAELDDPRFADFTPAELGLWLRLTLLTARRDPANGTIPFDSRWICGRVMPASAPASARRPAAIARMIEKAASAGLVELITDRSRPVDGGLQLALDAPERLTPDSHPQAGENGAAEGEVEVLSRSYRGPSTVTTTSVEGLSRLTMEESGLDPENADGSVRDAAATGRNREKSYKGRDLAVTRLPEKQLTNNSDLLERLLRHACPNNDPKSRQIVEREARGLPDAILARTLESLLARRPRPRNPAGYVVATLRRVKGDLRESSPPAEPEPTIAP